MGIFDKFKTQEELLEAVKNAVAQDGEEFFLSADEITELEAKNEERDAKLKELQSKFDSERTGHQKARTRAQEVEKRLKELEGEIETKNQLIDDLNALNPEQTREQLKSLMTDKRELEQKIRSLESQLPEREQEIQGYKEQLEAYQARDLAARKKAELRKLAEEAGVWSPAISDIEMLYNSFQFDNLDQLVTYGDKPIPASDWIQERLKVSPHWHAPSIGGNSRPSRSDQTGDFAAKAAELRQRGDITGAIAAKIRGLESAE